MKLSDYLFGREKENDNLIDECSEMLIGNTFNPFNITIAKWANQNIQFPDLTTVFQREIQDILNNIRNKIDFKQFQEILGGYTFQMVEAYYNNAGYVPKLILDKILKQIYTAAQSTTKGYLLSDKDFRAYKYRMYYAFTHNH